LHTSASHFFTQRGKIVTRDIYVESDKFEISPHDQADHLCSEIKTAQPGQLVAFVCNWRVAIMTDCPDEIVRTEFDPAAFVQGVRDIVPPTT